MDFVSRQQIKRVQFEGLVLRCGCSDQEKTASDWHGSLGQPCHQPRIEDLGVLATTDGWFRRMFTRLGLSV